MNAREKFLATCEFEKVPPPKWEFGYWGETIDNWYNQGLPKNHPPKIDEKITTPTRSMFLPAWQTISDRLPKGIAVMAGGLYWPTQGFPLDFDVKAYFGMDWTQELVDVNGLACPMFEPKVVNEDERYWDFLDVDGVVKRFQKEPQTMPAGWEWPVKDWNSWNEYKERVNLSNITKRLPENWNTLVERYRERDFPLALGGFPHGFFGTPAHLMGYDTLFISYYESPDLVHDIVSTFTDMWIALYEEVLSYTDVDHLQIWEDISFGSGSMVSDDIIREFQVPYYKKMTDFLKGKGVKYFFLDTDGDCMDIIPLFMEGGINGMYPFEWHCGMRAEEVRTRFPDLIIMGNVPKSEIPKGKKRIDEVLAPVEKTMKRGGYIPYGDHFIPPDVDWENFQYYRNKLNAIIDSVGSTT
jgi:uroporphyrinogen decarboxylase